MSKNFELLRRIQRERELFESAAPLAPSGNPDFEVVRPANIDAEPVDLTVAPAAPPPSELVAPKPGNFSRDGAFKLVQRVFLVSHQSTPRTVVFCGVEDENGSASLCARAAEQLAERVLGSVCVVDANLPKPSLHAHFRVDNVRGLAEAVLEHGPVRNFAQRIGVTNLWLMPAGPAPPNLNVHAVMASDRLRQRIAELRTSFEYVLINAPAATGDVDAVCLAVLADGVLLIVEPNFTPRQAAQRVKEDMEAVNARVLGVVMNKRPFPEKFGKPAAKR